MRAATRWRGIGFLRPHFKTRIWRGAPYLKPCTACDKPRRRGPKRALSRAAKAGVFALWVYAYGAIDSGLLSMFPEQCAYCRPAGRMNASTADHAGAWFQGTDWLEAARNCRKPADYRPCDHDAGPHPQGRRYRRCPDGADRYTTAPHHVRRAVRDRGVLHAHLL